MSAETPTKGEVISISSGKVVATGVTEEEYMERYAAHFCEWVGGTVIKMSPVHLRHAKLTAYLLALFQTYLELRPIGNVVAAPFVMRVGPEAKRREPDLQVIPNSNPPELTNTYMDGPADIVVVVISPESVGCDHGEKFKEYEAGGVPEYWIIDPVHEECRFYRLGDDGIYIPQQADSDGDYHTPVLPGFALNIPTLWQEKLSGPLAIGERIKQLLKS